MEMLRCKGMRDWLPSDMRLFRRIEATFRNACLKWGYEEVRTPTLEYLHLFTASGTLTPQMLGRVYSFLDWDGWSGERVVLRPDGTIPAARLYLSQTAKGQNSRLFYVENVFSFEETGQEARERWQCGVESLGSALPAADAELVLLASEVLQSLGVRAELRLGHLGLVRALLQELGLRASEQTAMLDQALEGNLKPLAELSPPTPEVGRAIGLLLELKGAAPGFLRNIRALLGQALPGLRPSMDNFLEIADLLTTLGKDYKIDLAVGKGFEYYTGIVFQLYANGERLAGGGRYDELLTLLGKKRVPASGFALYIEHLMRHLGLAGPDSEDRVLLRLGPGGQWQSAFSLAQELRRAGFVAELDFNRARLSPGRWVLLMGKEGTLELTDRTRRRRSRYSSPAQVIQALEGAGATKIGPA